MMIILYMHHGLWCSNIFCCGIVGEDAVSTGPTGGDSRKVLLRPGSEDNKVDSEGRDTDALSIEEDDES